MDAATYLRHIAADGAALGEAARSAPSTTAVPSCPEWDLEGLVRHQGAIHHWVIGIIDTGATERPPGTRYTGPESWDEVLGWYDEGVASVVDRLTTMDADARVWNWWDNAPAPSSFWRRRMAHETAVHRWDGENAVGTPSPIDADLAVDGIDEWLLFLARVLETRPASSPVPDVGDLSGVLRIETGGRTWTMGLAPKAVLPTDADPDLTVSGDPSAVFLWSLGRLPLDAVTADGDLAIADAWKRVTF